MDHLLASYDHFCSRCETVLYQGPECNCGRINKAVVTDDTMFFRVTFNKKIDPDIIGQDNSDVAGPKVEKYCNRCNLLTLHTYFTAQLRSADEGQTVFYRCIKCMIQTNENS